MMASTEVICRYCGQRVIKKGMSQTGAQRYIGMNLACKHTVRM
jgi:DNA-directed RNA polymerase subunit RPC12/RpoP